MFFLLVAVLLSCSAAYGQTTDPRAYFLAHSYTPVRSEVRGISVCVDPRMELLQILMILAGNPHINAHTVDYKIQILDRYAHFRQHPAVQTFGSMVRKKFNSLDGPTFFFLRLTPSFTLRTDMDNDHYRRDPDILMLLEAVGSVAADMDFVSFFNENEALYRATLSTFLYNLRDFDERESLLNYYKIQDKKLYEFNIILNLLGKGHFGPGQETNRGQELYAVISPDAVAGSLPVFDSREVQYLVWHEFSHHFCNRWIDAHYDQFQTTEYLYAPIRSSMAAQGYADWRVTLKEHLVRSVTCRLAEAEFGEAFAEWNFSLPEIGKKYIYLPIMINVLKQYELHLDMDFGEAVLQMAIELSRLQPQDTADLLAPVQRIRSPEIEHLPLIGEVTKKPLIILPKGQVPAAWLPVVPWPGVPMTPAGNGWYYHLFEHTDSLHLIFNNGAGQQTADLKNVRGMQWFDGEKQAWTRPDTTLDIAEITKPNAVLAFFKPPASWKGTPMVYSWNDESASDFPTFIRRYSSRYDGATILEDEAALTTDLSGHDIIVFGNFENNAFLRKYYSGLPVRFTENGIIGDRLYQGEDLVFICAWAHPSDKNGVSELYITRSLEHVVNIDWVERGGSHYHITRGLTTIRSGNFVKRMKIWRF